MMSLHPLTIIALTGGLPIIILLLIGLYFEKPEDEEGEEDKTNKDRYRYRHHYLSRYRSPPHPHR